LSCADKNNCIFALPEYVYSDIKEYKMKKKVFTETVMGVFPKTLRRSFEGAQWDLDDLLKVISWKMHESDRNMLAGGFCPYEVITIDDSRMFRCYSN
jgi:hypothetical protein